MIPFIYFFLFFVSVILFNEFWSNLFFFVLKVIDFIFFNTFNKNLNFFWDFNVPATPLMDGIINLHHDIISYDIFILVAVTWMLYRSYYHFYLVKPESFDISRSMPGPTHNSTLEFLWTLFPFFILGAIVSSSLSLLYAMDECIEPSLTIKITGNQWYWGYSYDGMVKSQSSEDFENYKFSYLSYMLSNDDFKDSTDFTKYRLLKVDKPMVIPVMTHIRLLVTSSDVIHSWAVPALGIKIDGIPGRLQGGYLFVLTEGIFYGQCSELCGINHAFMPIAVEAVDKSKFIDWVFYRTEVQL
uniref:Cytochrome c oxidase subunit 2 n=1 Tax=Acavomonas peruviana TaxID=1542312 RepID=V5KWH6_9ALVE|nr:cytochrome c oxidase subunit 2 [Acavomonas peruviana]AHA41681.1 cytochrome c oxidase subunit 2 [Acavomonas peruviana]